MVEIIGLEQHIVKLDEIEARFQPNFVAFGSEHPVDTEVPADITKKFDVTKAGKPVGIVQKKRFALPEVQKTG
jgi:hypothetical protein